MKRRDVFQTTFLGKDDVQRPFVATIAHVGMEEIRGDNGKESKAVIHFSEKDVKPLICNNINWTTCEEAYGDESDFWQGKRVEVYVDPNVMFGGKRIGGVRLRIPKGNASPVLAWTLDQCVENCAAVGISKDEMIAALKARGNAGFNMVRDTPFVEQLIAAKVPGDANEDLDDGPGQGDIPFSWMIGMVSSALAALGTVAGI